MIDFINESVLAQLTMDVWSALLSLEVQPIPSGTFSNAENSLASCVRIRGAWSGTVALFCSAEVARQTAAVLFSAKPGEVTIDQMEDVVGEMTNVIGGNLKALAPQPVSLALPTFLGSAKVGRIELPQGPSVQMDFVCENQPFRVAVFESSLQKTQGEPNPQEASLTAH
jgi:chemotaxis protein CheX